MKRCGYPVTRELNHAAIAKIAGRVLKAFGAKANKPEVYGCMEFLAILCATCVLEKTGRSIYAAPPRRREPRR